MSAIGGPQPDLDPEVIKSEDACQLGKWLNNLPPEDTRGEHFAAVKKLHADYHRAAGEIAELVMAGKRDEAMKRIEVCGQLANITSRLVMALRTWQSKL
jgi:hypothetical protein